MPVVVFWFEDPVASLGSTGLDANDVASGPIVTRPSVEVAALRMLFATLFKGLPGSGIGAGMSGDRTGIT